MTAQTHERLILDGKKTSMAFCPPLPLDHPRLIQIPREDWESKSPVVFSTACWRLYIGTWEIKDGRFYLRDIEGQFKLVGDEPLLADWFTGVIRITQGELLHYVHMGFGTVYEEELHIKIEAGRVTDTRVIDNRNKDIDDVELIARSFPGLENRFDGDDEL